MIVISARMQARPGFEDAVADVLQSLVAQVGQEPGALAYALHRSLTEPARFFFYERYADQAAVDAHMATPYLASALARLGDWLSAPPEVEFHTEMAAIWRD